jgi:hypothetical protein
VATCPDRPFSLWVETPKNERWLRPCRSGHRFGQASPPAGARPRHSAGRSQLLLTLKGMDDAHSCDRERDQDQRDDDCRPNPPPVAPVPQPSVQERGAELALTKRMQFQDLLLGMGCGWQVFRWHGRTLRRSRCRNIDCPQ